jgi:hypothetical protein
MKFCSKGFYFVEFQLIYSFIIKVLMINTQKFGIWIDFRKYVCSQIEIIKELSLQQIMDLTTGTSK